MKAMTIRDWIVIRGSIIDSTQGGGYEFFGPFTEGEAKFVRERMHTPHDEMQTISIQLLKLPNLLGKHWLPDLPDQQGGKT